MTYVIEGFLMRMAKYSAVEGVTLARDSNHEVRHFGEFESLEDAIVVAKQITAS